MCSCLCASGDICRGLWEWKHFWGTLARGPEHICHHCLKCTGEQLGNILPRHVATTSSRILHLLRWSLQCCLDGRCVSTCFTHNTSIWLVAWSDALYLVSCQLSYLHMKGLEEGTTCFMGYMFCVAYTVTLGVGKM